MDPVVEVIRSSRRPPVFRHQPDALAARYELFAKKGWSMRCADGIPVFTGAPTERRVKRSPHTE
jgi:hypothetical protein